MQHINQMKKNPKTPIQSNEGRIVSRPVLFSRFLCEHQTRDEGCQLFGSQFAEKCPLSVKHQLCDQNFIRRINVRCNYALIMKLLFLKKNLGFTSL
jgi:hypothetical protein